MDVRFAPDGKRFAYSVSDSLENTMDIWIYDPSTPEPVRFASGPSEERFPVWSRDGSEIVFSSDRRERGRSGTKEIFRKSVTGGTKEEWLPTTKHFIKQPWDFSPDGKYLSFVASANEITPKLRSDIYLLTLKGNGDIIPWLVTDANDWDPRFSPDGEWVAYCSEQSKQFEVFVSRVKSFSEQPISVPPGGERTGGRGPRWASDGKEIFYLTLDNRLVVVQVRPAGQIMQILNRKTLFQTHANTGGDNYDVSPDGKTILIVTQEDEQISPPAVLVTNWTSLDAIRKKK
jgi:Tol biopolymer transport system component